MTRRVLAVLLAPAVLALAGCGAAATPIPSAGSSAAASQAVASETAPSAAAPSTAASAPASEAAPSGGGSLAIPSFELPSSAKDLEALLPSQMCGSATTKLSQTGPEFMTSGSNEEFANLLQAIGKSPNDVAYALSIAGASGCGAGIFRIKGVDANALAAAFAAEAQKSGDTFTDATIGGKQVKVQTTGSTKSYLYFKGDAILFATANNDADAASILQQLP